MSIYEIILLSIGVLLLGFSLFMIFRGSVSNQTNFTIQIFGVTISLNTPVLIVFVLGVVLLFNPTINKYVSPSPESMKGLIDKQINKKIDEIVKIIDSGYSEVFVFSEGDKEKSKYLLFYAVNGQKVDVNVHAPYDFAEKKLF